MIQSAIDDFGIDIERCAFIGDSWRDEGAAAAAGIKFFKAEGTGTSTNILECVDQALASMNTVFESSL
jgi:histidinol phosphatase-like enzyme